MLGFAAALTLTCLTAGASARQVDLRKTYQRGDKLVGYVDGALEKLSLSPTLQKAAERLLASSGVHEGAIVASDVRTGKILAWASRGARDYVVTPYAPSASVFKLVTSSALIETAKVRDDKRVCYVGGEHEITEEGLRDRPGPGASCTPFKLALGHSVNLVFARLAKQHLGPQDLMGMAEQLGFVGEVPIDVDVASSTLRVPSDPFGLARAAAGFWNGKLSPLGALFAMQTIARGGERIPLSILDETPPQASLGRAMSPSTASRLRSMLEVTTRSGTCKKAFTLEDGSRALPGVRVAAKTGTLIGGKPSRMYSWFTAFAPANKPEIAVAVMLGNDVQWTTKGNVVGRQLLEAYFDKGARRSVASKTSRSTRR